MERKVETEKQQLNRSQRRTTPAWMKRRGEREKPSLF
jgi:hypothetical protein